MTVGYGLWALSLAKGDADDTTAAMVNYLVKTQHEDGYWAGQVSRPPMEESHGFCTVLAVMGIRKYAVPAQKEPADAAVAKAKIWLAKVQPSSQEDKAARLWGLYLVDAAKDDLDAACKTVLSAQRDDGGWPQVDGMESDAYATGQTLFVLHATETPNTAPACERGIAFLLKTQRDDGSWYVKSRSKPVQVYFDNGDPHGKDQFISTPATCWAVVALAKR
jgi:N-acyl-D-amino-acid deacylase